MKTVMPSSMVAHTWAHQSQHRAWNASRSFSFEDRVCYSYQTPIAMLHETPAGLVALITSDGYTMTTKSKHLSEVSHAIRGVVANQFRVPYVGAYGGWAPSRAQTADERHAVNVEHLAGEYRDLGGRIRRAKWIGHESQDSVASALDGAAQRVRDYCHAFGATMPELDPADDARVIWTARVQREAKANTPEAVAKRERAKEQREARERARIEREAKARFEREVELRGKFRNGERTYYSRVSDEQGGALLRFDAADDTVRTSWGAEVPAEHARKAWPIIARLFECGEAWRANGHTLHLGPFAVSHIEASGTLHAGCHRINRPEIEACAKALGLA